MSQRRPIRKCITNSIRLVAFQPYFPESEGIKSALVLISATHALSFYSLTLQHGIPFQPVNIRVHPDPISLISKVLDQNSRSYTKLEDLVEIGGNLVKAGMFRANGEKVDPVVYQEQRQLAITKQRIVAMAISASLAEEDFDTAYSYIVNRLQLAESSQAQDQPHQSEIAIFTPIPENDITWRAAYEAGQAPLGMGSGQSELRRLEQRMELLSQALLLAPINAVGEILETWRNCEEEMSAKATQEVQVEKIWDDQGSKTLPGNFTLEDVTQSIQKPRDMTRNALNEEAPMGLFDVARGAASALSRSAFPLRNPRSEILNVSSPAKSSPSSSIFSDQDGREGEGRVRKRDMVSNMVTGGLVSGIGWVLGLYPPQTATICVLSINRCSSEGIRIVSTSVAFKEHFMAIQHLYPGFVVYGRSFNVNDYELAWRIIFAHILLRSSNTSQPNALLVARHPKLPGNMRVRSCTTNLLCVRRVPLDDCLSENPE